jgi:DNA-binding XRE family transcriptional regulator
MTIKLKNAEELKKHLMKEGYTLRSFGLKAEVSHTHIMNIIHEKNQPSPKAAKKIAEALNLTFDDLFFIENDCKSNQ